MRWSTPLPTLLSQYQNGTHREVWQALHSLGPLAGEARRDAKSIAVSTMEIVRRNAEILAERLDVLGWKPLTGVMVGQPCKRPFEGEAEAAELGALPLPVALEAFWEVVGSLDFVWDYRRGKAPNVFGSVPLVDLDPLCVDGANCLKVSIREWKDMIDADIASTIPFHLDLSPDALHKADISGGSPYGVHVPEHCADPMFFGDDFSRRFTDYLRQSFCWGGFPGLRNILHLPEATKDRVSGLTRGLLPF